MLNIFVAIYSCFFFTRESTKLRLLDFELHERVRMAFLIDSSQNLLEEFAFKKGSPQLELDDGYYIVYKKKNG